MSGAFDDPPEPPPDVKVPRSDDPTPLRARSGALTEATGRPTVVDNEAVARRRARIFYAVWMVAAVLLLVVILIARL